MRRYYRVRAWSPIGGSLIMGALVIVVAVLALVGSVVYALVTAVVP